MKIFDSFAYDLDVSDECVVKHRVYLIVLFADAVYITCDTVAAFDDVIKVEAVMPTFHK